MCYVNIRTPNLGARSAHFHGENLVVACLAEEHVANVLDICPGMGGTHDVHIAQRKGAQDVAKYLKL
jgi:hypothetical protein